MKAGRPARQDIDSRRLFGSREENLQQARVRFGALACRLSGATWTGDPLADALVADMVAKKGCRDQFEQALRHGIQSVRSAPASMVEFFEHVEQRPDWVDLDLASEGGEAYLKTGPLGMVVLAFGSLPASYYSAIGNKPLVFTKLLVRGETVLGRLAETGEFVRIVSEPNALAMHGPGYRELVRVRLIHAMVRHHAQKNPAWKPDEWGVPISQFDMAAGLTLFSRVAAVCIRKLGYRFSAEEEEALTHLWRYAGHLLGVDELLVPKNAQEAARLVDLVYFVDPGPDNDSRRLISAIFDKETWDNRISSPFVAKNARALGQAATRYLLGAELSDELGIPRNRTAERLLLLSRGAAAAMRFLPSAIRLSLSDRAWAFAASLGGTSASRRQAGSGAAQVARAERGSPVVSGSGSGAAPQRSGPRTITDSVIA